MKKYIPDHFWLLLTGLLILLPECTNYSGSRENSTQKSGGVLNYNIGEKSWPAPNKFTLQKVDTTVAPDNPHGLLFKIQVDISRQLLDSLTATPDINAFFMDLEYKSNNINYKSHRRKLTNSKEPLAAGAETPVIEAPGKHIFLYQVPYRKLKLSPGNHQLNFHFRLYPITLKAFRSSSHYRITDKISKNVLLEKKISLSIETPPLYKIRLNKLRFRLDPDKKAFRKYDFNVGGPGHPDLFWEIKSAGETLFTSGTRKNQTHWKSNNESITLLLSKQDPLTLSIMDKDKAVNRSDEVGSKTLPVNAWLNQEDIKPFGYLKTFTIQITKKNYNSS